MAVGCLFDYCGMIFLCRVKSGSTGSFWTRLTLAAGHLVPEGSMFAFLAAHRTELFPDAAGFAGLCSPPAGPAVDPGQRDGHRPDAAGAVRLLRRGDRRGGPVRPAVEGGLRVRGGSPGVRPLHAGVLAAAAGRL